MKRVSFPGPGFERWLASLPRASSPRAAHVRGVERVLRAVRDEGDRALVRLTRRFDGVALSPARLRVKPSEIRALAERADPAVVDALGRMAARIEAYHRKQLQDGFRLRLADGSMLEERVTPLASAGLYVPGGRGAYPSSVLMGAIPARVAGVERLVIVTPPRTLEQNPAVAAAIAVAGAGEHVYRVGGAQAIAALAYGTRTIPAVLKVVGPGNAWVATAKRLVRDRVEIDSEAGPSELAILADDSADAGHVAADLLAQAEHGSGDEAVALVTPSRALGDEVARLVAEGRAGVANREATRRALARNAAVVLVRDLAQGVAAVNRIAPEHAGVVTRGAARVARGVVAGAVFVGPFSPVAAGDYGIGPNHVLPTGGSARFAGPLSVRDFQRRHSVVQLSRAGLRGVTEDIVRVAMAEGFRGHAQSVLTRFEGE